MSFKKVSQLPPLTNLNPNDQFLASYNGNSYKLSYDTLSADLRNRIGPTPDNNFIDCIFKCETEESQLSDLTTLTDKTFNGYGDKFVYETNQLHKPDGTLIGSPIKEYVLRPSMYPTVQICLGTRWNHLIQNSTGRLTVYSGENYILMYRWAQKYNGNTGSVPERASFTFISDRAASSEGSGIYNSRLFIGGSTTNVSAIRYERPFIIVPPNSNICPPFFSNLSEQGQTRASFVYDSTNAIKNYEGSNINTFMTPSSGYDITTSVFIISENIFDILNIMF